VAHANERFRPAQFECLAADFGLVPQLKPTRPKRFGHLFGRRMRIEFAVLTSALAQR
jgi:hypothetical protein